MKILLLILLNIAAFSSVHFEPSCVTFQNKINEEKELNLWLDKRSSIDSYDMVNFDNGEKRYKILKMFPATLSSSGTIVYKEEDIFLPEETYVMFYMTGLNKVTEIRFFSEYLEYSPWILPIEAYEADVSDGQLTEFYLSYVDGEPYRVELMKDLRSFIFSYNYIDSRSNFKDRIVCIY